MSAQDAAVKTITSLTNPIVKEIRGLALAKNRKESGLFLAEGLKLVADAVEAGWTCARWSMPAPPLPSRWCRSSRRRPGPKAAA